MAPEDASCRPETIAVAVYCRTMTHVCWRLAIAPRCVSNFDVRLDLRLYASECAIHVYIRLDLVFCGVIGGNLEICGGCRRRYRTHQGGSRRCVYWRFGIAPRCVSNFDVRLDVRLSASAYAIHVYIRLGLMFCGVIRGNLKICSDCRRKYQTHKDGCIRCVYWRFAIAPRCVSNLDVRQYLRLYASECAIHVYIRLDLMFCGVIGGNLEICGDCRHKYETHQGGSRRRRQ